MGDPRIDRIAARQAAQTAAARLTVAPLMADTVKMSDEQASKLTALFDVWETKSTTPDPFVHPTGAADAYSKGDRVTFEGAVWESVIDANVWSPSAYPAGWKAV